MEFKHLSFTQFGKLDSKQYPQRLLVIGSPDKLKLKQPFRMLPDEIAEAALRALKAEGFEAKPGAGFELTNWSSKYPSLKVACLDPKEAKVFQLEAVRDLLKSFVNSKTKSLGVLVLDPKMEAELADSLGSAVSALVFQMPLYGKKKKSAEKFKLDQVSLICSKNRTKEAEYGYTLTEGSNLVRSLGFTPSNDLSSANYGSKIRAFAKQHKLNLKFISNAQLKKMGAGAFTAVDQGDPNSKGGIYELSYSGTKAKNKKPVALVGKGLCFDTGGYDIKTSGFMQNMKGDMQGSAVALASILTAARLKLPLRIKCFLGVTENHISPLAYKADDVITALNGTSIEIVNTDAEGRMVLADTLCIASKAKPDLIMDYATLTGMAVYAIGKNYSAGFTNQEAWHSKIVDAGVKSGERVWTFPMDKDYEKNIESKLADTLQCSKGRGVDHINAAMFLQKFVGEGIPWVHIDLSGAEKPGGAGAVSTEYTGFGVRWTIQFLKDKYRC